MIEPKNPTNNADEYAHLPWQDHPNNPANYPDMANQPQQRPLSDDEISWEDAHNLGIQMMTQSEFEALTGLDAETDAIDHT